MADEEDDQLYAMIRADVQGLVSQRQTLESASNIFAILGLWALYFVLAGYLAGLR